MNELFLGLYIALSTHLQRIYPVWIQNFKHWNQWDDQIYYTTKVGTIEKTSMHCEGQDRNLKFYIGIFFPWFASKSSNVFLVGNRSQSHGDQVEFGMDNKLLPVASQKRKTYIQRRQMDEYSCPLNVLDKRIGEIFSNICWTWAVPSFSFSFVALIWE